MAEGNKEEPKGIGALSYEDLCLLNEIHGILVEKIRSQYISPTGKKQLGEGRRLFNKMLQTAIYLEKGGRTFGTSEPDDKGRCLYGFAIDAIVMDESLREHINQNYQVGKGFTSFFREVYRELMNIENNPRADRKNLERTLNFIECLNGTLTSTFASYKK